MQMGSMPFARVSAMFAILKMHTISTMSNFGQSRRFTADSSIVHRRFSRQDSLTRGECRQSGVTCSPRARLHTISRAGPCEGKGHPSIMTLGARTNQTPATACGGQPSRNCAVCERPPSFANIGCTQIDEYTCSPDPHQEQTTRKPDNAPTANQRIRESDHAPRIERPENQRTRENQTCRELALRRRTLR